MRAAVFKGAGQPLVVETVADPRPGPSDLILEVKACGICGTDLHWTECREHGHGFRTLAAGAVLGHEFAGEVVEVGPQAAAAWRVGDRVCALPPIGCGHCEACRAGFQHRCGEVQSRASDHLPGAYAEYTRAAAHTAFRLPDGMSYHEGALVEPLAVGLRAVGKARIGAGGSALVLGAGPVGLSVALWCRHFGAREVVVSDLVVERAARALGFGATASIDASTADSAAEARRIIGAEPDVVFDCIGVPGSMQLAFDHAGFDAQVVIVGLCMGADRILPAKALAKELDVSFAFVYRHRDFALTIDALDRGHIRAVDLVTGTVGLDDFPERFESLKKPGAALKVMVEPR